MEYSWLFDENDKLLALQKFKTLTGKLFSAKVLSNGKLDECFRDSDGMIQGIVPDKYLKEYKNYVREL